MSVRAVNFDGLIGPTHNYAGLAPGNFASQHSRHQRADPRAAALQGLAKMRRLLELGFVQGVLPPLARPDLATLRRLGFTGSDAAVLAAATAQAPELLAACASASSMWVANAATVCPSADSPDGRVHFTPANLCSLLHRSLEAPATAALLQQLFADPCHFVHHAPLPAHPALGDEGAANHIRLSVRPAAPGVQLFVYGRDAGTPATHLPARQSLAASRAVARLHGLDEAAVVFARQHPAAIEAGAFHNDVIAIGHGEWLLHHEEAFLDSERVLAELDARLARRGGRLQAIGVPRTRVSLRAAVDSYLFNSQLLARDDGSLLLLVPQECREQTAVWAFLEELLAADNPIRTLEVVDLRQSMRNGGGPACLRLCIELTDAERAALHPGALLDAGRCTQLEDWVRRHYRDGLSPSDLADPQLLVETRTALDELTQILKLGAIYPFQQP